MLEIKLTGALTLNRHDSIEEHEKLNKAKILHCFNLLNAKLESAGEDGEIVLFGGAAMCLLFGSREYTRDIDAIFQPKSDIYQFAREIAMEENLPANWLNDGVKGWLYAQPESELIISLSHLKVSVAKPEYILAMKCHAARLDTDDLNDAKVLVRSLGLISRDQVLDIVEKYIPSRFLSVKTVAFAEAIFDDVD